jgi:hypothetical protein
MAEPLLSSIVFVHRTGGERLGSYRDTLGPQVRGGVQITHERTTIDVTKLLGRSFALARQLPQEYQSA